MGRIDSNVINEIHDMHMYETYVHVSGWCVYTYILIYGVQEKNM